MKKYLMVVVCVIVSVRAVFLVGALVKYCIDEVTEFIISKVLHR